LLNAPSLLRRLKWDRMVGDAQTKTSQDMIESWDAR